MHRATPALALCCSLLTSASYANEALSITGPLELVDADTFEFGPGLIRLHGIDAPEVGQSCNSRDGTTWPCGGTALDRLREMMSRGDLACVPLTRAPYGRIIARCSVDGIDLSGDLIDQGLAWPYG